MVPAGLPPVQGFWGLSKKDRASFLLNVFSQAEPIAQLFVAIQTVFGMATSVKYYVLVGRSLGVLLVSRRHVY